MRISNNLPKFYQNTTTPQESNTQVKRNQSQAPQKEIISTGIGIDIHNKFKPSNVVKDNHPNDPLVAKKILDSLDLGFINFSQREREAIASILNEKKQDVVARR